MHLQGSQAGVLLGAVFAVEGRARGRLYGQRGHSLLQGVGVVGDLVVGQSRQAAVAAAAVQAVVEVRDDVRAGGVRGASAILLFLATAAAAGGGAAEVQRAQRQGGQHGGDGGEGSRQGVDDAGWVAGQGRAVVVCWEFSPRKALWDKS